jgi:trimeric autotransporter adhesin
MQIIFGRFAGAAALLSLAACGGGGDSSAPIVSTPEVVATTPVTTTVIDGALENATVCLDKNINGACDADEPSGKTDVAGSVTIEVPDADVGKYPILAVVGTDAIDADTGAVPVAFTLKAPADKTGVVSPLTTLVQAHMETSGATSTEAAETIKDKLGLGISAFDDFTKGADDSSKQAGTVARLIVVTTQTQRAATADATGTDGQTLTQAQIDAAINARLLQMLPSVTLAVLDSPVLSSGTATQAEKEAAILAAAGQVAAESGLTKDNIGVVVQTVSQPSAPDSTTETPTDTMSLRWFQFTDINNYMFRVFKATAAQNTPDADGKRHFTEYRDRKIDGVESEWGDGLNNWVRPQIYWTGTEWFDCPTSFVHEATPFNAAGESQSLYCDSQKSSAKRYVRDISGLKIIDVVKEIRAYPLFDSVGNNFANWGPNPAQPAVQSALGTTVFPAGSKLIYQTSTDLSNPEYYDRTNAGRATIPPASDPMSLNMTTWRTATLAEFTAWNTGDLTGSVTEVHGNNSRVILNRDYLKADGSAAYKRYMVGFDPAAQKARFYECEGDMATRAANPPRSTTLFIDGKSTCRGILDTTYTVTARGDGKVLRFASEPTQLGNRSYRLFVERSNVTYVGGQDKLQVSNQQRLNLQAAEALGSSLGLN